MSPSLPSIPQFLSLSVHSPLVPRNIIIFNSSVSKYLSPLVFQSFSPSVTQSLSHSATQLLNTLEMSTIALFEIVQSVQNFLNPNASIVQASLIGVFFGNIDNESNNFKKPDHNIFFNFYFWS